MPTPIDIFDYKLPEELIALRPSPKRDECRLLIADSKRGSLKDSVFKELPNIIDDSFFIVVNNTRVRNARLDAVKTTGGKSELFITDVLSDNKCKALVKGRFKNGSELIAAGRRIKLLEKDDDGVWLIDTLDCNIESLMENYGHVPLPPYITRADELSDKTDYQTVYSKNVGSCAAPTAGLHFTEELLDLLQKKGVEKVELTLDVGLGTFRPVKTATLEEHPMHSENFRITEAAAETINDLKKQGKNLIAIGSTTVRALESAAVEKNRIKHGEATASLLISPGFDFKMTDHMITNFHLPKSTLLAMVSALGGYDFIMKAYKHAVDNRYRFFSYGDAMFITT
ncbi:MAG: tRNA preQ1(34) S-adenosylmethionine ribosyltransferase-isomerase QueA [Deferribacterales bacterium]|nr:tRNA preQ1(34) S-adenosylmethionine ribosyltransferase-isomerase QueA [Deferribacterales bacterium]